MKYLVSLLMIFSCLGIIAQPTDCAIIPTPVEYTASTGTTSISAKAVVVADAAAQSAVARLKADLAEMNLPTTSSATVTFKKDASIKAGGYNLTIGNGKINIAAAGEDGFFNGVESLLQLAEVGKGTLENCSISDYPRFEYRGLMLDVVRYFIPKDDVLKMIDVAARLKLNKLHLHLCDDNGWRLEIKSQPNLTKVGAWRVHRDEYFPMRENAKEGEPTPDGGFYTQKEMREIVKYAADRNITVIPEIEMPAHSIGALASYPEYTCPVNKHFFGVLPGIGGNEASTIFCAGNENVYTFLQKILDEVMAIFPSEYIHIGGDEADKTNWRECPLCNDLMQKKGLTDYEALQGYFMDRVIKYVNSKGRKALGWDEVTMGKPKEDITIFGWRGDGSAAVKYAKETGRRFVMTPAKTLYLIRYQGPQWFEPFTYFGNNTLKDVYEYEAVKDDWSDKLKSQLWGIQGSMWTEFCNSPADVEHQVFPRLVALADAAWRQPGTADWQRFLTNLDLFTPYLERKNVNYAKSMYNIDHKVSNGFVELNCIRPDVQIRYTLDRIDPSDNSLIYVAPIPVDNDKTIKATTFMGNQIMGETLTLKLSVNKATNKTVTSPNHKNGMLYTLTNGLRGSERNSDFEWAGWHNGTAEFTVDLGEKTHISSICLGALAHSGLCIAAPKTVYVYASDDNYTYNLINTINVNENDIFAKSATILNLTCDNLDINAQFVKFVAINPGAVPLGFPRETAATWMYFDEIIIQ
jgi:hexosaminidase